MSGKRDSSPPLVSVIIPTRHRADLLIRAVMSVLSQTLTDLEIVVVIDGEDAKTKDALRKLEEPRLSWIVNEKSVGGSAARNMGVEAARSKWIALLDDDDEWLPQKLEKQLEFVKGARRKFPVLFTKLIARSSSGDLVWPRRNLSPGEPVSEYLFCRKGVFFGDGQFQTSALFTSRDLLLAQPFLVSLSRHQDTEWYLRLASDPDVEFLTLEEPLTIWHIDDARQRVTAKHDWKEKLDWANSIYDRLTPRAYSSLLLASGMADAIGQRSAIGFLKIYKSAIARGRPRLLDLALPIGFMLVPKTLRHHLRMLRERLR